MNTLSIWNFQCFTSKEVKEINKEIKKYKWEHSREGDAKDTSKIGNFFLIPCLPLMELLHPWLYQCQKTNKEVFFEVGTEEQKEGFNSEDDINFVLEKITTFCQKNEKTVFPVFFPLLLVASV